MRPSIVLERFEKKYIPVTESGCWLWLGAIHSGGYGVFRFVGKAVYAHRFSYETYKWDGKAQVSKSVLLVTGLPYPITFCDNTITIGCYCKTLDDWKKLTLNQAKELDGEKAVLFFSTYRSFILTTATLHTKTQ